MEETYVDHGSKDHVVSKPIRHRRHQGNRPMDTLSAGPAQPEQTDHKDRAADASNGQTQVFGFAIGRTAGRKLGTIRIVPNDDEAGKNGSQAHCHKGHASDAGREVVSTTPDGAADLEHHVKDGIDESQVQACQAEEELVAEQQNGSRERDTLSTVRCQS